MRLMRGDFAFAEPSMTGRCYESLLLHRDSTRTDAAQDSDIGIYEILASPTGLAERMEIKLKITEMTAAIEALTGGHLSLTLKRKTKAKK